MPKNYAILLSKSAIDTVEKIQKERMENTGIKDPKTRIVTEAINELAKKVV